MWTVVIFRHDYPEVELIFIGTMENGGVHKYAEFNIDKGGLLNRQTSRVNVDLKMFT